MFKRRKRRPRRGFVGHLIVLLRNLLILALLLGGGAWLYVYYQLSRAMDELAAAVAPVATLTYDGAFWLFGADVGVRGIALIPFADGLPTLRIDQALVHTPGPLYVLGLRGEDALPMTLGATLAGMRIEGGDGGTTSVTGLPFEALGCADITRFQAGDLRNMQLDDPVVDLSGRYFISPPDRVDLTLIYEAGGVAETSLELKFLVPNLAAANRTGAVPDVRLASLKASLDAGEFNTRRNRYCARRARVDVAEFLDAHMRAVVQDLRDRNLLAGPSVTEQYRQFATGKGPWTFIARPDRALPMAALAVPDPLQLIERLNLTSALESTIASPVVVTRIAAAPPPALAAESSQAPSQTSGLPPAAGLTAETGMVRHTRWVTVDPAQASGQIDRVVRIRTRFGQEYTGRLTAVDDGQLKVETRFPGGAAVVPIPVDHVVEFRVQEN